MFNLIKGRLSFLLLVMVVAVSLGIALQEDDKTARAADTKVTGKDLFNGYEDRGAFVEMFPAEGSFIYRTVNRDSDDWHNGTDLVVKEEGQSSKFYLEWNSKVGAFRIFCVKDQHNSMGDSVAAETFTDDLVNPGPYVWDVDDNSNDNNRKIHIWSPKNLEFKDNGELKDSKAKYQFWNLYRNDQGLYYIQNLGSGSYLTIGSDKNANKLVQHNSSYIPFEIDLLSAGKDFVSNHEEYYGYAEDWMSGLPDGTLLSSINIPGTHDTGTAHIKDPFVNGWARDQKHYYIEQLSLGCRTFDIRLEAKSSDADPKDVFLVHSSECYNRFDKTFYLQELWDQSKRFLEYHPNETIILCVKHNSGDETGVANAMAKLISEDKSNGYHYIWMPESEDDIPSLMEARGKIVLLRRYSIENVSSKYDLKASDYGIDVTGWDCNDYKEDSKDKGAVRVFKARYQDGKATKSETAAPVYVQDAYNEGNAEKKYNNYVWPTLKQTAENSSEVGSGQMYVYNYNSVAGADYTSSTSAKLNHWFYDSCDSKGISDKNTYIRSGNYLGQIMFNFVDKPLARNIINTNFAQDSDFFVYDLKAAKVEEKFSLDSSGNYIPQLTVKMSVMKKGKADSVTLTEGTDYKLDCDYEHLTYTLTALKAPYIGSYTGKIPKSTDLAAFGQTDSYTPEGTESAPYIISSEGGWNKLCDVLADKELYDRFADKYYRLDADVSVSRMAGDDHCEFKGTFDGNNHILTVNYNTDKEWAAPFRYTDGTVLIKDLTVNGTIITSQKYAAGFVSNQSRKTTLQNCRSGVTIKSSVRGDGTHGGFVAHNNNNGDLYIYNCVFDGTLEGTDTIKWGGFVGWSNGDAEIYDSYFTPAKIDISRSDKDSATFCRKKAKVISNCYYSEPLYVVQGTKLQTLTVPVPTGQTFTYTGKAQTGVQAGSDYSLSGTTSAKNAGTYTAKAALMTKSGYICTWSDGTKEDKTIKWKINKAANPLKIKTKTTTVKYSKVRKKAFKLIISRAVTLKKKGQGGLTCKRVSGNKKITINKTTGKVTLRKGLKKGTYKVKIKVKANGNENYKPSAWKTVTFKIKVK